MINYDIIICVGWKDVFIVRKTIKYIRKNLSANMIYLIMNEYDGQYFHSQFCKEYKVIILDEDKLIPNLTFKSLNEYIQEHNPRLSTGWYFQQFLKIGFALSTFAQKYYLIWDADTLPLSKIPFEENGKLLFTAKKEFHQPYFSLIEKLWGLKKVNNFSYIAEHMIIQTSIMKEMIRNLNAEDKWYIKIMDSISKNELYGFSEFESYGTYVYHKYPQLYKERTLNTWRNAGVIFGRTISDKDIDKLSIDLDIISLESWCGCFFFSNIKAKLLEFKLKYRRYRYMKKEGITIKRSLISNIIRYVLSGKKTIKI